MQLFFLFLVFVFIFSSYLGPAPNCCFRRITCSADSRGPRRYSSCAAKVVVPPFTACWHSTLWRTQQTTKWLAYGCHTSVLLVDWCVPFLVLFQLCDVPQTLNIQHSHPSSGFLHGRRLMNKDVVALAGVFDFALLCLCCRSFSLSASLS